jgi:hypothetical protein
MRFASSPTTVNDLGQGQPKIKMMTRKLRFALFTALTLGFATASQAITITGGLYDGVDVGSLDDLEGVTSSLPNSKPATEAAWVNSILGPGTVTSWDKEETVTYYATDAANTFAFALLGDPGYYVIKNAGYWALFQNNASSDWGVFSSTLLPAGMNLNGGSGRLTISHVTSFNPVSVPEPATLGLLGLGLLGVGFARRRKA